MIPDEELERCLDVAEQLTDKYIEESKISLTTIQEIRDLLKSQYDMHLFRCLQKNNYAQHLAPDKKSDQITTMIELRKGEYSKKLQGIYLK